MPVQPRLFPNSVPDSVPESVPDATPGTIISTQPGAHPPPTGEMQRQTTSGAPVWLQRTSLFVLVLFCVYLGVLMMALPWWPRMWDQNLFLLARPSLFHFLHIGAVRGIISGLGAIDIWIGISEAVHYREIR